ncbi:Predicted protein [Taphrina deformans PYCC 5710]|uniref:Pentatricopeptide repeat-containing protein-mitochondrial domain-containing protein n=1 Tax=Taphrina deformans (strain PYCC 5710 / ATCC 11124 / CBS 356.35 / IMI 108563 / JCM 9778 / NBRC 8474) TaxID=1097556 RepID=R4XC65_TAPDE|nr:Predicted protein [Taphrina deformans PYCC 5710]|eukprot:CCG81971.1 Predicted protein [Taphrina deformans PYCC 5710]
MAFRRPILSCRTWRCGLTRPVARLQSSLSAAKTVVNEDEVSPSSSHSDLAEADAAEIRNVAAASRTGDVKIEALPNGTKDVKHEEVILKLAMPIKPRAHTTAKLDSEDEFDWARDVAAFGMLESLLKVGGHPSPAILEAILKLATHAGNDHHVQTVLDLYEQYWLPLSTKSLLMIGQHYCDVEAYEQCFAFFDKQINAGREIPAKAWLTLTLGLLKADAMDVALGTLQRLEDLSKRNPSLANTPATLYIALISFSDAYHLKGTQWTWHRARRATQQGKSINLDMGACTNVLNYMDSLGMSLHTYHYAALIQSYCVAGDVKNAFMILTIMREAGVAPTSTTAGSILEFMSTDPALIDRAYFTLEDLKTSGAKVDIAALNAIIDACVAIADISRAVATFQDYKKLDVQPNADTMNSLLTGCVAVSQKDLALSLIKVFREELQVTADSRTYTLLISVCILQENYEDAFRYLEEMKEEGHQPSTATYELLIRRCVSASDTRADIAYDEMKGWGYRNRDIDNLMNNQRRRYERPVDASSAGVLKTIQSMTRPEAWFTPQ